MTSKKTASSTSGTGTKATRKKTTRTAARTTTKKTTKKVTRKASSDGDEAAKPARKATTTRTRKPREDSDTAAPPQSSSEPREPRPPSQEARPAPEGDRPRQSRSPRRQGSDERGDSSSRSRRGGGGNSPRGNSAPRGNSSRGNSPRGNSPRGNSPRGNSSRGNSASGNSYGNAPSGNSFHGSSRGRQDGRPGGGGRGPVRGESRSYGSNRSDSRYGGRGGGGAGGQDRRGRGGRRGGGRKRDLLDSLKMLQSGVSVDPYERIRLETTPDNLSTRVFDLVAPIGRGQRCLITSPPKAGKTMLLMTVAEAIIQNHPDIEVVCLLIDERPEEVTYFRRGVDCKVVASSNDMPPMEHVRTAEAAIVQVAETVAEGKDVVLLLDSITRLARAYNICSEGTGRTLSGGIDASTMYGPRRIFGAARKIENGGSLTILGTALVDTGSRMDEVIFQEFKGTGNTEVILSRPLAEKRIYPAIDIISSGSRREEKLYSPDEIRALYTLRRFLADRKPDEAMLGLIRMMERYPTNREVLEAIAGGGGIR